MYRMLHPRRNGWIGAALLCAIALAPKAASANQLSASSTSTVLSVIETSSGGTTSETANVSAPTHAGAAYSGTGTGRTLTNANLIIGEIPALTTQSYSTTAAADSAMGSLVSGGISQIAQNVKSAEASGALSRVVQTVFTYSASVTITSASGNSTQGIVNDTCDILPNGQYSCLGANYGSATQYTIFAIYSQGAVASGLPTGWTMPNPGELQWALLELQDSGTSVTQAFVTVSGTTWHTINLLQTGGPIGQYGEYDQFQVADVNVSGTMTQALVNCAATASSACTTYKAGSYVLDPNNASGVGSISDNPRMPVEALAQNEIAPLEKQYGADQGVLLYGTTVAPVYTGSGSSQTAEVAVNIATRTVTNGQRFFFISPGGASTFDETGTYGYLLSQNVDEYTVDTAGDISYVTSFDQHAVSPPENFSKSVTLTNGQTISGTTVINPFPTGNQLYSYTNDTVNGLPASDYVYVAPIVYQ